jgi:hypothetical protein
MTAEFVDADLSGAQFRKVRLNDARFRQVDLTGVVMRSVSLSGAAIDGELWEFDGLRINGVEVIPLVEAELTRRDPTRALVAAASDPAGLRAAWTAIEQSWAASYDRVAAMPPGTVEVSVEEEWTFAQTLRHLIFATDAWLGAVRDDPQPFHPWGLPFSDIADFIGRPIEDLGVDQAAAPSYPEVLEVRAGRVAAVREYLAAVTSQQLAEEHAGPAWEKDRVSTLRCLRVILNEECEHRRFAERDLDLLEARS